MDLNLQAFDCETHRELVEYRSMVYTFLKCQDHGYAKGEVSKIGFRPVEGLHRDGCKIAKTLPLGDPSHDVAGLLGFVP